MNIDLGLSSFFLIIQAYQLKKKKQKNMPTESDMCGYVYKFTLQQPLKIPFHLTFH